MKQAMKRLGIQEHQIDAVEVIIRTPEKELVFANPQVSKVDMMGQNTYQIVGTPEERPLSTKPDINEEDIKTVMDQTNCSEEDARKAIEDADGDLASAIMKLRE